MKPSTSRLEPYPTKALGAETAISSMGYTEDKSFGSKSPYQLGTESSRALLESNIETAMDDLREQGLTIIDLKHIHDRANTALSSEEVLPHYCTMGKQIISNFGSENHEDPGLAIDVTESMLYAIRAEVVMNIHVSYTDPHCPYILRRPSQKMQTATGWRNGTD